MTAFLAEYKNLKNKYLTFTPMKKLIPLFIIIILLTMPFKGYSQDTLKLKKSYLLGNNNPVETQFMFGPELKVAQLLDGTGIYTGFKGAIIFNHRFALGLTGGGFVKDPELLGLNTQGEIASLNIITGYGGLYLDYFLPSKSFVHISFFSIHTFWKRINFILKSL